MSKTSQGLWVVFIVAVVVIAAIGAHGADRPGARGAAALDARDAFLPATQVISYEDTVGLLELQRATFNHPDVVFLVDTVSGRTWLLNRRGDSTTTWDPVKVYE
ncbi:MAG: hypothetical protein ACYTGG_09635 [Planctomycetota bacterium]|jgi:hypothetical protein